MNLPVVYKSIPYKERWKVREEYIQQQKGRCYHCKGSLDLPPDKDITEKRLDLDRFPLGFLNHPVHLHHSHKTGLTLGAVHAYCNGVLWQYHGE